ncbi:MAG: carbohydrate ABC transporter permease [Lachnospiraceae bacterium]|nr:carbohydrate ABC transporter permease [Lachnospiraceae bacterium]
MDQKAVEENIKNEVKDEVKQDTKNDVLNNSFGEIENTVSGNVQGKGRIKSLRAANWSITILLILGVSTVLFPLYMTIVIAFKQPSEMTNSISGILSLPKSWSLSNFSDAMEVTDFWNSLGNSLFITLSTVALAIILHSLLGYVLGRSQAKMKGYRLIYYYVVSGMFVPFAILMMPLVKQTAILHLDNMFGVILLYTVFYMPMNVMLYSGYLTNIPTALEEAAYVDGSTTWKTYWRVIYPVMKPMHATVAILTALGTWNDVMTPLVIMSGSRTTLPLAQLSFQTQFGANYNLAFASYLLALLPIIIFYIVCQKQILSGVVNGAVK